MSTDDNTDENLDEIGGETEADDDADPDTVETLTVATATNADVTEILLGEYTDRQVVSAPERFDGGVFLVKRLYEPTAHIGLEGELAVTKVREWVKKHRNHDALAALDWERFADRPLLEEIVTQRSQSVNALSAVADQLAQIPVESDEAAGSLRALQQEVQQAASQYPPVVLDRVESELQSDTEVGDDD